MSNAFHDFLVWFDGWSENIYEQPSPQQWERLKAKVASIAASSMPPTREQMAALGGAEGGDRPERPAKVVAQANPKATWLTSFKRQLIEIGYDPESADEMAPALAAIDASSDPVAAAKAAHRNSGAMN